MPEAIPPTLVEVIARNVATKRRATTDVLTGEPQSQAGLARVVVLLLGLPWTQSTVAAIEAGGRRVSAVELVALSMVLETPIAALLDPGEASAVEVGEAIWSSEALRRIARGDLENIDEEPGFGTTPDTAEMMRTAFALLPSIDAVVKKQLDDFEERWGLDPTKMSARQHRAIAYADGSLERDVAARIRRASSRRLPRIESRDVAGAAWKLWTRSYAEERDRRVDALATPDKSDQTRHALRGHIVRQLDRELLNEMSQVLGTIEKKRRK